MPNRSEEEIRKEYAQACAAAGELQYNIKQMQEELDNLNTRIFDLNGEFKVILANRPKEEPKSEANPSPDAA